MVFDVRYVCWGGSRRLLKIMQPPWPSAHPQSGSSSSCQPSWTIVSHTTEIRAPTCPGRRWGRCCWPTSCQGCAGSASHGSTQGCSLLYSCICPGLHLNDYGFDFDAIVMLIILLMRINLVCIWILIRPTKTRHLVGYFPQIIEVCLR